MGSFWARPRSRQGSSRLIAGVSPKSFDFVDPLLHPVPVLRMCIEMGLGPPSAPPSGNMSTHACSRKAIYGGLPSGEENRFPAGMKGSFKKASCTVSACLSLTRAKLLPENTTDCNTWSTEAAVRQ
jgi:hypothetical protein